MNLDELLRGRAQELANLGLFRDPTDPLRARAAAAAAALGLPLVDLSSNDYLGLAQLPVSRETSGAGGSRLIGGTTQPHDRLERGLADWLGTESALLFSSGYAANVGVLSALGGPGETILSDRLNHASIIDGCRLSPASTRILDHRNPEGLRAALGGAPQPCWVVSETYFSMDGTSPALRELRAICDEAGAFLVVDEAHALGVFGDGGRGLCHAAGIRPDVLIGTFGKAFGVHGAFVAGSAALRDFLWNRARSFVFSTATSPALAETLVARLGAIRDGAPQRQRLARLGTRFGATLAELGFQTPPDRHGPIFPLLLGSPSAALRAAEHLADRGILAPAIRPPTVPQGSSRLRITLNAALTEEHVSRATHALASLPRP